jgi:dTDP-glucose 4,6-dehydratase
MTTMIVTGGAGFIGANYIYFVLSRTDAHLVIVDKLTYAGNLESLVGAVGTERVKFILADITDREAMEGVFRTSEPTAVVNFAAESHVDRSIDNPLPFIETNIVGTYVLLEVARQYLKDRSEAEREAFRFLHVSTDEVYGSLGPTGLFSETTPYAPNSPYAASKASADHLVRAYHETYGLPALVTNCSNNYGPYQFPEKLIPLMTLNAIEGKSLPIYGDGGNIRDWLFVEDHCAGIDLALNRGRLGEKYNIGGGNERTNLQIVDRLCEILEELLPPATNQALVSKGIAHYSDLKKFVADRPGHDRRYAIDATKIHTELGWEAANDFESGLRRTVEWYLGHRDWCEAVTAKYNRDRLGVNTNRPTGHNETKAGTKG